MEEKLLKLLYEGLIWYKIHLQLFERLGVETKIENKIVFEAEEGGSVD